MSIQPLSSGHDVATVKENCSHKYDKTCKKQTVMADRIVIKQEKEDNHVVMKDEEVSGYASCFALFTNRICS